MIHLFLEVIRFANVLFQSTNTILPSINISFSVPLEKKKFFFKQDLEMS